MAWQSVYWSRIFWLQERLREMGLGCAVIRTLSDFKYLMGIKWLRPVLVIPSEGLPKVFVALGEEEGFLERSKVKDVEVITYVDGDELVSKVLKFIEGLGVRRVGVVLRSERDSFTPYYGILKGVEVVDLSSTISGLRALKEEWEIELIKKAGEVSSTVLEKALSVVDEGLSETDIAAEAYYKALKLGSEEPLIYVNVGPHPRAHAEPSRNVVVRSGVIVNVVVGSDYEGYYANTSASVFVGDTPPERVRRGFECVREAYDVVSKLMTAGEGFQHLVDVAVNTYRKHSFLEETLGEYIHGVGLRPEEYPVITVTSVLKAGVVCERMVLASVHTPLMLRRYGSIKLEDTFVITKEGPKRITTAYKLLKIRA